MAAMRLGAKQWQVKAVQSELLTQDLLNVCQGSSLLAKLLILRGITSPEIATQFLNPETIMPQSPFVFEGMDLAVDRLQHAIANQQNILVYGDFDVDGLTGTSVLYEGLKSLGAKVTFYVPSRHEEGHGLHTGVLCRLVASRQIKVVVTTDTGTGNFNEVSLLNGLGVDVIITDHHELPENLPFALAVLNPLRLPEDHPCRHFAGAGMAFQLMRALYETIQKPESDLEKLLDLAAIGTIVDMVPLKGDNRYWVKRGLGILSRRGRLGLSALLKTAGMSDEAEITTTTVGFTIGPRLNAIGRMMRADEAIELLTSSDMTQAEQLAAKLEQLNRKRQEWVDEVELEARHQLESTGALTGEKVVLVASPKWNPGIVGLVATRLVEAYSRPALVGVIDEAAQQVKFSGRSLPGVHLTDALRPFGERFIHWGGHAAAAGFAVSIADYPALKNDLLSMFRRDVPDEALKSTLDVDLNVRFEQMTLGLVELMDKLTPFGQGNPEPVFMLENVRVSAQRYLGEGKRHLKLILQPHAKQATQSLLEAVCWGWNNEPVDTKLAYDIVFKATKNTYQGQCKLQLVIEDIRVHGHGYQATQFLRPSESQTDKESSETSQLSIIKNTLPFSLVDKRSLQEVDAYLLELLQNEETLVFSEGTQTFMPLPFPTEKLCSRKLAPKDELPDSCQQLVLWDYPTDMVTLVDILKQLNPKEVHVLGAKYRYAPLIDSPTDYLRAIRSLLLKMAQDKGRVETPVTQLAKKLATSQQAVLASLSLFSALNVFQVDFQTLPQRSDGDDLLTISPLQTPPVVSQSAIESRLEYKTFASCHADVQAFRRWWMESNLTVIESSLSAAYL